MKSQFSFRFAKLLMTNVNFGSYRKFGTAGLILQLSFLQDQGLGGSSLVVASFGDALMDAAPEGPLQDVIEAKADGQLKPSDAAADLRHTESNWKRLMTCFRVVGGRLAR